MNPIIVELEQRVIAARENAADNPDSLGRLKVVINRQQELIAALKEALRQQLQGPFATEENDGGYSAD